MQCLDRGHLHPRQWSQLVLIAGLDDAVVHVKRRELGTGLIDDLASMRDHERAPDSAMNDSGGDDGLAAAGGRNDENLALAPPDQTLELAQIFASWLHNCHTPEFFLLLICSR
jgi:hypothetical protein